MILAWHPNQGRFYAQFTSRGIVQSPASRTASTAGQTITATASLLMWQAPAPLVTRLLRVSPGQEAWLIGTPTTRYALTPAPSSAAWQAASALLHRRLLVTPPLEAWLTSTPNLRLLLTPPAASASWLARAPLGGVRVAVSPSRMEWFAPSAIVAGVRIITVSPGQILWHPETLLFSRRLQVSPSRMVWQTQTPQLVNALLILPSRMAWKPGTPGIPAQQQLIVVLPSRMAWHAQMGLDITPHTLVVTPAQLAWLTEQAILSQTGAPFARRAIPVILSINERNEAVILGFV